MNDFILIYFTEDEIYIRPLTVYMFSSTINLKVPKFQSFILLHYQDIT